MDNDQNSAAIMQAATEQYRRDNRFRMIAMSCVAAAMHEHGPVDPESADQDAHDIALLATATLLQHIYTEDAELVAIRHERDRYKKLAEDTLAVTPPRLILQHP